MRPDTEKVRAPRAVVRVGASISIQGISSIANLLVALLVARELGPRGLGQYAFCLAALFLFVSMQTVWVGDSYTVLAKESVKLRQGVLASQILHALAGAGLIIPLVRFGCDASWLSSFIMGGLLVAWEFEEFGRRVLMAHQQFGRQGCTDAVYLVGAVGALSVFGWVAEMTLELVLTSMLIGALLAFLTSQVLLGSERRFRIPRWDARATKDISSYGVWRAAQTGSGFGVQLIVRFMVVGVVSLSALGQLEAARLVAAPLFTAVASVNNIVLPALVPMVGAGRGRLRRRVLLITAGLSAVCVAYAAVAVAFTPQLTSLLAGSAFEPSRLAVGSWCLLGLVTAAILPASTAGTIVLRPSMVFRNRLVGNLSGLALALPLIMWDVSLLPLALALGLLVSGIVLGRRSLQSDRWLTPEGR